MQFTLGKEVKYVLDKLNQNGTGFLVGGAIRDMILGIIPDDYDFATDIDYDKLKIIFKEYNPKEVEAHFGILMIKVNGKEFEIAKYRKEIGILNSRYPKKIKFVQTIIDDLARRDFTINALAYNEKEGLIDLYGGVEDIKNKVVRFVGNPKLRIEEDALRIMRAFRFMSKLGFELDKKTENAIYEKRKFLNKISRERIFDEISKILVAPYVKNTLKMMKRLLILDILIPDIKYLYEVNQIEKKDTFQKILSTISRTKSDLITRLSALFYQIGKVNSETIDGKGQRSYDGYERESSFLAETVLKYYRASNEITSSVKKIVYNHLLPEKNISDKTLKKIILDFDDKNFNRLLDLIEADLDENDVEKTKLVNNLKNKIFEIMSEGPILRLKDLDITGVDLINIGFDNRSINNIKLEIYEEILDKHLKNDKQEIVDYLIKKYNLTCELKYEKSCGAVIYSNKKDRFLIVKMYNGNWGFAKGHIENGETEVETAIREVKEETNVDIEIKNEIRKVVKYIPNNKIFKEVVFFLGETVGEENIILQEDEIEDYEWCNVAEGMKLITYKVQRDVLNEFAEIIYKNKITEDSEWYI